MKPILEHVPNNQQQSLFFNQYEKKVFSFPWHYHPQWELTYILAGTGTAYTGNAVRHYSAGELVLVAPNIPHCWKSDGSSKTGVKSVFAQWDNSFLGDNWLTKPEFASIQHLFEQCHSGLSFIGCEELGESLNALRFKSPFHRTMGFVDLLHELSLKEHIEPLGQNTHVHLDFGSDKRIEAILNHITDYFDQKITAADMAAVTNMTPVSFSKYFTRTFSKPFTQFLNEFRVSQACGLLVSTELSVEQIAYQCGYQNMSFFHRQFKTITGQTPNGFRSSYLS
ncbi:AraC family transcriptional regulator [Vibrio sp. WXL103]|uniref:AraC family transcriptional regulator n=1 Tax=Vibrio sp. WXL103 TaxID=3450710 RepID=UPI003EC67BBB